MGWQLNTSSTTNVWCKALVHPNNEWMNSDNVPLHGYFAVLAMPSGSLRPDSILRCLFILLRRSVRRIRFMWKKVNKMWLSTTTIGRPILQSKTLTSLLKILRHTTIAENISTSLTHIYIFRPEYQLQHDQSKVLPTEQDTSSIAVYVSHDLNMCIQEVFTVCIRHINALTRQRAVLVITFLEGGLNASFPERVLG